MAEDLGGALTMMAEDLGGTFTVMAEAPFSLSLPLYFSASLFLCLSFLSISLFPFSVAIFSFFLFFKQLVSFYTKGSQMVF